MENKKNEIVNGILIVVLCLFSAVIGGIMARPTIVTNTIGVVTSDTITGGMTGGSVEQTVYENISNTVVEITNTSSAGGGSGSGVMFAADNNSDASLNKYTYIITNHHVIESATKLVVRLKSGDEFKAKLVGSDSKTDIAVIKIEKTGLSLATVGDSTKLKVGDVAIAVGNPLGTLGGTVTQGIISAIDRDMTIEGLDMTLIQTDAAVSPGNSGGGLFSADGKLIGVVNAKSSGSGVEGIGFAIPTVKAMEIAEELMTTCSSTNFGYVTGRYVLGLTIAQLSEIESALYGGDKEGVYVYGKQKGGDAENSDIVVGDRVVSINGTAVTTMDEAKAVLDNVKVGDTLTFVVSRYNKTTTNYDQKTVTINVTQHIYSLDLE